MSVSNYPVPPHSHPVPIQNDSHSDTAPILEVSSIQNGCQSVRGFLSFPCWITPLPSTPATFFILYRSDPVIKNKADCDPVGILRASPRKKMSPLISNQGLCRGCGQRGWSSTWGGQICSIISTAAQIYHGKAVANRGLWSMGIKLDRRG